MICAHQNGRTQNQFTPKRAKTSDGATLIQRPSRSFSARPTSPKRKPTTSGTRMDAKENGMRELSIKMMENKSQIERLKNSPSHQNEDLVKPDRTAEEQLSTKLWKSLRSTKLWKTLRSPKSGSKNNFPAISRKTLHAKTGEQKQWMQGVDEMDPPSDPKGRPPVGSKWNGPASLFSVPIGTVSVGSKWNGPALPVGEDQHLPGFTVNGNSRIPPHTKIIEGRNRWKLTDAGILHLG